MATPPTGPSTMNTKLMFPSPTCGWVRHAHTFVKSKDWMKTQTVLSKLKEVDVPVPNLWMDVSCAHVLIKGRLDKKASNATLRCHTWSNLIHTTTGALPLPQTHTTIYTCARTSSQLSHSQWPSAHAQGCTYCHVAAQNISGATKSENLHRDLNQRAVTKNIYTGSGNRPSHYLRRSGHLNTS